MTRIGRIKFTETDAWYHLYSRVAAHKGVYPLLHAVPMRRLIKTIEHFSAIYFCDPAAFCVMGNHYHLVVKFDAQRMVSREELRTRTRLMYPSQASQIRIDCWSEKDWEHYRRRLFDVSEYMRNIQSAFARWFNFNYQRRGRFWADRFKSVYLEDKRKTGNQPFLAEVLLERYDDLDGPFQEFLEANKLSSHMLVLAQKI